MRAAIVIIAFLPFLYYAIRDARFHFVGRRVTFAEHILHLAIGIALAIVLMQAIAGNSGIMLIGLLLLVLCGGMDEYIWHRNLPEAETNLHAKEHLALLIFVVATLAVNWLEDHQWRLPQEFYDRLAMWPGDSTKASIAATPTDGSPWWRSALLPVFLLPYVYFGLSDNVHHFKHRHISLAEKILHATIVLALFTVIPHAVTGNRGIVIGGLVLFLIARAADEWGFHRNLNHGEADMHAKTHFAFLIFVVMLTAVDWVADQTQA